jgi:hypothetical protein
VRRPCMRQTLPAGLKRQRTLLREFYEKNRH